MFKPLSACLPLLRGLLPGPMRPPSQAPLPLASSHPLAPGSGVVTTQDLGRVMNAFGLEPSQDELHNMITEVDGSGAWLR